MRLDGNSPLSVPKAPRKDAHAPPPKDLFCLRQKIIAKIAKKILALASRPAAAADLLAGPPTRRLAPARVVLSRQGSPPSHLGHRGVARFPHRRARPPAPDRASSEAGSRTAPRRHLLPPSPPSQRQPRGPSCSSRPRALVAASSPPTSRYIRGGPNCFVLYPSISSLYCGVAWNPPVSVDAATQARAC